MSSEPERPIEKLLRACGKERRDKAGGSWEIHPATRRLLQQEVARRFGPTAQPSQRRFGWLFGQWWLRPVGVLGALAVLVIAAWLFIPALRPKKAEPLLVKNEQSPNPMTPSLARSLVNDKIALKGTEFDNRTDRAKQLLADKAGVTKLADALDSPTRDSSLGKDSRSAPLDIVAQVQSSAATPNQSANRAEPTAIAASGGFTPSPLADSQSPAVERRYGLARGARPASVPTAAPAPTGDAIANAGKQLGVANESAKTPITSATLITPPPEVQLANLAAALALNAANTDLVQYGYFANAQTLTRDGRVYQQASQYNSATKAKTAPAGGSQSAYQILASFRIEQSGRQLRVIDSDDSVYAGPVQAAAPAMAPASADEKPPIVANAFRAAKREMEAARPPESNLSQQAANVYVFRVVGTNRSSNQRVIFSGTLSGDTNNIGIVGTTNLQAVGAVAATVQLSNSPANSPTQNLHLSGKAVIGVDQEVEIEAVPASPQQIPR